MTHIIFYIAVSHIDIYIQASSIRKNNEVSKS